MAQRTEDANEAAARVMAEATRAAENVDALPADAEGAWLDWIGRMQGADARMRALLRALLRAAFEAGYESATAVGSVRRTAG